VRVRTFVAMPKLRIAPSTNSCSNVRGLHSRGSLAAAFARKDFPISWP